MSKVKKFSKRSGDTPVAYEEKENIPEDTMDELEQELFKSPDPKTPRQIKRVKNIESKVEVEKLREELERYKQLEAIWQNEKFQLFQRLEYVENDKRMIQAQNEEIMLCFSKLVGENLHLEENIRIMHERIQELKGNIRVYCRFRPCLKNETEIKDLLIQNKRKGSSTLELKVPEQGGIGKTRLKEHTFEFDHIFDPKKSQEDVYKEVCQLIKSVHYGSHVSIFAYGQTGSGKTFTMQGYNNECEENRGLIYRAIHQIFHEYHRKDCEFTFDVSFLEIYKENIRDLLNYNKNLEYTIRHLDDGTTQVSNLEVKSVKSPKEVFDYLNEAIKNRVTSSTKGNDLSSRSHSIFTIRIHGKTNKGERVEGILNLIDLAGSERMDKSNTTSEERISETKFINSSLSALGDVFHALVTEEKHIPYRNSKLTYLLQNSLSGKNSKCLMFVNVTPNVENVAETINSLKFASKVNTCKIK